MGPVRGNRLYPNYDRRVRALLIQHDHLTSPGPVGERFAERGYKLAVHQVVEAERFDAPDVQTEFPDPVDFDAIVPMGAPWSAYDHATGSAGRMRSRFRCSASVSADSCWR